MLVCLSAGVNRADQTVNEPDVFSCLLSDLKPFLNPETPQDLCRTSEIFKVEPDHRDRSLAFCLVARLGRCQSVSILTVGQIFPSLPGFTSLLCVFSCRLFVFMI